MLKASGLFRRIFGAERRHHQLEIVFAMAGRGMDKAGAGIGGDMLAGKQRHFEVVALAAERMRAHQRQLGSIDRRTRLSIDLRMLGDLLGQHIGKKQCSPAFASEPSAASDDFIEA